MPHHFFYTFLLFLTLLSSKFLHAQKLEVTYSFLSDTDSIEWGYEKQSLFTNKEALTTHLKKKQFFFQKQGYLLASVDTEQLNDQQFLVNISLNRKIEVVKLNVEKVLPQILNEANLVVQEGFVHLKPSRFVQIKQQLLDAASRIGYPFAKVTLANSKIGQAYIESECIFLPGNKIFFDSVLIRGDTKTKSDFLARYLGIKENNKNTTPFSQSIVDDINEKISALPYITLEKKPNVLFRDERAQVELFLKDEKINKIDGMLGVVPSTSENNTAQLNGFLNLDLHNFFGRGENFKLRWTRVKSLSPMFELQYHFPQLFSSKLNLHLEFFALQQDSVFRNINWHLGLSKNFANGKKYGFQYYRKQSIGLTDNLTSSYRMPLFGLKLRSDFLGIYKKGTDVLFGKKPDIDYSLAAGTARLLGIDSLSNVNNRFIASLRIQQGFRITKFFSIVNQISSSCIIGENLYPTEAFRLGGFNSIRGFDENLYFASSYFLARNELRMYIEDKSFFYLFCDVALLREVAYVQEVPSTWLNPYGAGLGIELRLKSGNLKIASGLGINGYNQLTLQKARFHFGYTAVF